MRKPRGGSATCHVVFALAELLKRAKKRSVFVELRPSCFFLIKSIKKKKIGPPLSRKDGQIVRRATHSVLSGDISCHHFLEIRVIRNTGGLKLLKAKDGGGRGPA